MGTPTPAAATASHTPEASRTGRLPHLIGDLPGPRPPRWPLPLSLLPSLGGLRASPPEYHRIPVFQAVSVLPMRGLPLHPHPKCLCCFYTLNGGLFLIYIIYGEVCVCEGDRAPSLGLTRGASTTPGSFQAVHPHSPVSRFYLVFVGGAHARCVGTTCGVCSPPSARVLETKLSCQTW